MGAMGPGSRDEHHPDAWPKGKYDTDGPRGPWPPYWGKYTLERRRGGSSAYPSPLFPRVYPPQMAPLIT